MGKYDSITVIKTIDGNREVSSLLSSDFSRVYDFDIGAYFDCELPHLDVCDGYYAEELWYEDYRKEKISLYPGNVVRWNGSLYVVKEYSHSSRYLVLMPFNSCNASVHLSDESPLDPRLRVSSVQRVAMTIEDYLVVKFKKFMEL